MKTCRILWIAGLLMLAGCQSLTLDYYQTPGQLPPAGSSIELHQTLEFQVGYSRSFIQFGKAINFEQLRVRYPHCLFYRYEPPEALQTLREVQPDRFVITDAWVSTDLAAGLPVFSGSMIKTLGGFDGDGPSSQTLTTTMRLESPAQPEIIELRCSIFTIPYLNNYLTLDEIINTLGEVATLQIDD